ncbi:hypothetical protein [Actinomadura sp. WMMA1423]|uniref:hypothetical protein n=1 Tax=Actinomadura sp. WMMA1423 TaxID=2591108 RepID=UPI001146637D|nr:hypothetical protein [Actinomadura sp. WMMA1423]
MPERSAAPGGTGDFGGEPRTEGRPPVEGGRQARLRRATCLTAGFAVSYVLLLAIRSDTFFWIAIPGMLGLAIVVLLALQTLLYGPFGGAVPHATDGTDRRGPVKYHYKVLVRRYLLVMATGAVMLVVPAVVGIGYLGPFLGAGLIALPMGTRFWLPQILSMRKCARVLEVYDFEFRAPVRKANLRPKGVRSLTLGGAGSPPMSAREPLHSDRWPAGIERGVWFAGDEPFGGVILVPDTGELMFVRPEIWAALDTARREAGPERQERAQRAGLARKSS